MNLTILKVYPTPREFDGKNGKLASVRVLFDDDSEGDVLTTPDKAAEHVEALQALKGKPGEFEIDSARERVYQGVTQRSIKSYPGKPTGGAGGFGGGGGRQFVVSYHQTKEGVEYEQERMDRRTALMQAVAMNPTAGTPDAVVIASASQFYSWLRATSNAIAAPDSNTVNGVPPAATANQRANEASAAPGTVWEGPGLCPVCHAPAGKRHNPPHAPPGAYREPETEDDAWSDA